MKKSAPAAFKLWRSDTGYTTKRSALIAHVVGPLLSAAETVLHGESDWAKFDRIVAQYGRRALKGRATARTLGCNGEILFRSWSNEKVRRHWRLPRARTEARFRRLKWLQEVWERPQVHCQVLAALFGDTLHGPTRASDGGRIIGPIGPWASRVVLRHQSSYSCLHHWSLSQDLQRTQSHLSRGSTALRCRICHGHQATPDTRSHPPTEPTTSHQDFPVPKTRGYLRISCRPTAPRHRTRDLDGSSPSPPSLAPGHQKDPATRSAPTIRRAPTQPHPKNLGKRQGREGEATPPGHGWHPSHDSRCRVLNSTEHGRRHCRPLFAANLISDRHFNEAGGAYHQEVQSASAGRRAELGPPRVHINRAMVASLVTQMQAMSPAPDPLMTLSQQAQWINSATLQQMEAAVTTARVSRTRQEQLTRLQFRVLDEAVRSALRVGLCTTGARHMVGTAPPNHNERILARHLNGALDVET